MLDIDINFILKRHVKITVLSELRGLEISVRLWLHRTCVVNVWESKQLKHAVTAVLPTEPFRAKERCALFNLVVC